MKVLFFSLLIFPLLAFGQALKQKQDLKKALYSVNSIIWNHHVISSKYTYDDAHSALIFKAYIDRLDPRGVFFTKEDIIKLSVFENKIDDLLLTADYSFAIEAYSLRNSRMIEMFELHQNTLSAGIDLTEKDTLKLYTDLDTVPRLNSDEMIERQVKFLKDSFIKLKLSGISDDEVTEKLLAQISQNIEKVQEIDSDALFETFADVVINIHDPHATYYTTKKLKKFSERMSGDSVGIGVQLELKDSLPRVVKVIESGPADKEGSLTAGDIILGVYEGENLFDSYGKDLGAVIKKITGDINTVVKLKVRKANMEVSTVEITRGVFEAPGSKPVYEVINGLDGLSGKKIAVITVSLYNDKTSSGTSKILKELDSQDIDGVILNLMNNGGGYLNEAVKLSGLFVKKANIVQVKDNKKVNILKDTDARIQYKGPLAVLVNRYSASASEITAGFLKDYNRALVIGERTFGKGTVQNVLDFSKVKGAGAGGAKLTTASFHRPNGFSTQYLGVKPDVFYPTAKFAQKTGEREYKNTLKVKKVPASIVMKGDGYDEIDRSLLPALASASAKRIKLSSTFAAMVDMDYLQDESDEVVSLVLKKRARAEKKVKKDLYSLYNQILALPVEIEEMDGKLSRDLFSKIEKEQINEAALILSGYIDLK